MKNKYKNAGLLLLAIAVGIIIYSRKDPGKSEKDAFNKTSIIPAFSNTLKSPDLPEHTVSQIRKGQEQREYHISYDE